MSSSTPPPPPPPPGGSFPPPPEPEEPIGSSATGGDAPPPPPPPPGDSGGYTAPPPPPGDSGGYTAPPPPPGDSGGYGAPPPAFPAPGGPAAGGLGGNNTKAVIALVLGIVGIVFAFCCWPVGLLLGIGGGILGYLAKQEIGRTGQAGGGLAQGGFVTGIIAAVLSIIAPIAFASLDLGSRLTGN